MENKYLNFELTKICFDIKKRRLQLTNYYDSSEHLKIKLSEENFLMSDAFLNEMYLKADIIIGREMIKIDT